MSKLKVLELFGGIGACSKALERLGIDYEIADYVEIDKYAVASFNEMHNTNFEPQDITQWDKDIEVDLIMHGSPCQDFSLAGLGKGGDEGSGTRSSLMYETLRIVEKLRPKYVIWENVKNLLSKKHRHNFDAYLETMKQLGYTNYYQVLNAKDYGIPQNRERVFTVSILDNKNYEFPKKENLTTMPIDYLEENVDKKYDLTDKNIQHYQREFGSKGKELNLYEPIPTLTASMGTGGGNIPYFTFPPKQELKLKLKDMLEDEVDEKYYLSDELISKITQWKAYQKPFERVLGKENICPTLTARGAGENHSGMITYSEKLEHTTNLQEELVKGTSYLRNFGSRGKLQEEDGVCDTLTASMGTGGGNVPIVKTEDKGYVEGKYKKFIDKNGYIPEMYNPYNESEIKDVAPTLSTQCGSTTSSATVLIKEKPQVIGGIGEKKSNNGKQWYQQDRIYDNEVGISLSTHFNPYYIDNYFRIRKLTPKECFRLMGFDDIDFDRAKKSGLSDSRLYKCAGNSIVVNVLEAILKNLLFDNK